MFGVQCTLLYLDTYISIQRNLKDEKKAIYIFYNYLSHLVVRVDIQDLVVNINAHTQCMETIVNINVDVPPHFAIV